MTVMWSDDEIEERDGEMGNCEGCHEPIDAPDEVGFRVFDDPAIMFCGYCGPKYIAAEETPSALLAAKVSRGDANKFERQEWQWRGANGEIIGTPHDCSVCRSVHGMEVIHASE